MAATSLPDVIKFIYGDFKVNDTKKTVTAKCKKCHAVISEKLGTTSAFVRHLSTGVHPKLRYE